MIARILKELTKRFFSNPFLFLFITVLLIYIFYDTYIKVTSGSHLIPINVFALLAGVIFESKRITNRWVIVVIIGIVSFFIAFAFLNFIGESLDIRQGLVFMLNSSISIWPPIFLVLYFIFHCYFTSTE
jgi:putative effector of murein hydrolase